MNNKNIAPELSREGFTPAILKGVLRLFALVGLMLVVLFISAGRLDWWEAWAYAGQGLFGIILSRVLLIHMSPDTAMERVEAAQKEGVKAWDKVLMPLTALYLPFISWIVAGLDERFGWSPDIPYHIQIIALVGLFLGGLIGTWAMLSNRFFSSHVRIQTDRGHEVVSQGPYRFVRHPGYAGGLVSWISAPVFFSSYWLALVAVIAVVAGMTRTYLEDQTLQAELPGYTEYTNRVRFRLIPGIW